MLTSTFDMEVVRVLLATLTCALVLVSMWGRPSIAVVCLALVALLAADDCRTVRRLLVEPFGPEVEADADAKKGGLNTLPWSVYASMAPSLEKIASAIRGDAGSVEQTTTDLTPDLYAGRSELHGPDGHLDSTRFETMKRQYKSIAVLLCRMKALAPEAHDVLITALGGCA